MELDGRSLITMLLNTQISQVSITQTPKTRKQQQTCHRRPRTKRKTQTLWKLVYGLKV